MDKLVQFELVGRLHTETLFPITSFGPAQGLHNGKLGRPHCGQKLVQFATALVSQLLKSCWNPPTFKNISSMFVTFTVEDKFIG